ncbi:MAG: DUF5752 family protein [Terriglobia bacterium]
MKRARRVFEFTSAAHLTRIRGEKATCLKELHALLTKASDSSVFHHTFQSLEAHHYLTEGFTNDFAQWTLAACNEFPLAEQLAAVDVRDYVSVSALRQRLVQVLGDYLQQNPASSERTGFEPFYFCETLGVSAPTGVKAATLEEFLAGIRYIGLSSIHFHFLTSRLRLKLASNDFSHWLRTSLKLPELAEQIERIDIYTKTLEDVRRQIVELAEPWLEA